MDSQVTGVSSMRTLEKLHDTVTSLTKNLEPNEAWRLVSKTVLKPTDPFEWHQKLHQQIYSNRKPDNSPAPTWVPSADEMTETNIAEQISANNLESYSDYFNWAKNHREAFWRQMIDRLRIQFKERESALVDLTGGVTSPEWLPDARLNIADSCFQWDGSKTAIVYQEPGGPVKKITYKQLHVLANRVANSLFALDLKPGDAVAIDMLMTVEAVAVYLGVIKAGMAVIGIADSFAPEEIATRLRLGNAKLVFTQDVIVRGDKELPMYRKVTAAEAPKTVVIPFGHQSKVDLRSGDLLWESFLVSQGTFASVSRRPADVTNILFSSGTTGEPKAIPWTHTTPIKCGVDAHLHHDVKQGDVIAWPTSLGWMMGPWLIYAAMLNKATIALYYGLPTGKDFCKFVEEAGINMLGLVPSLVKAWRSGNATQDVNWDCVRLFSSTGECSNAEDYHWLMAQAGYKPVIEYCGGTEIGGGYITGTLMQPQAPATFSTPALGLDFVLLDDDGRAADEGEVFIIPPSMGLSLTLLNRDHHETYYEGTPQGPKGEVLRRHGDQIERLPGGYYRAQGRADDTMNLGGIKVSSAEIERVVNQIVGVLETAAVAISPEGGGPSDLVIFAVLEEGVKADHAELLQAMRDHIKNQLNPLFKVKDLVVIDKLPRTASNKVMRRVLRAEYSK